ncbi:MAG TPA: pyridoxamine 5'-phosphate oxidase family protein [Patescibacteria group bacterium]
MLDIEKTIREYLPQVVHMSLATCRDNHPWVCEVHFAYDDELNLYFRSTLNRRHSQELLENPCVSGNIITQHFLNQKVRGVYFEGTAKLIESDEELNIAFNAIKERLHLDEEILVDAHKEDGHKFFKLSVTNFYLFDSYTSNPSQKYQLEWSKRAL